MNKNTEIIVNIAQIAEVLGISERRVQQLSRMNVFHKKDRNQYELFACIRGYLRYLRRLAMRYFGCYKEHLQHNHNVRVKVENLAFVEDIEAEDRFDAIHKMFPAKDIKQMETNYAELQQSIKGGKK